jgi:hypothetical protein
MRLRAARYIEVEEADGPSAASKIGLCESHSYHALFKTATRQMAVSRTAGEREVRVRIEPRKEFLLGKGQIGLREMKIGRKIGEGDWGDEECICTGIGVMWDIWEVH